MVVGKNCFFPPFKSHERDSIIRMLSAAARKPLWNPTRKMGPAENLTVPCAGLVNTKNILSKAAISFSYNWRYLWENLAPLMVKWSGSGLVHKDKHYVKKLALDADIRSTLVKLIGTAVFGCRGDWHLRSNRFHVWFRGKRHRQMEIMY